MAKENFSDSLHTAWLAQIHEKDVILSGSFSVCVRLWMCVTERLQKNQSMQIK